MRRLPLHKIVVVSTLALVAGCAKVAPPPVVATLPPAPVVVQPQMPKGGRPGMVIPIRLADGSYATPNRALTGAATVWHLRTALNVAALACRDTDEAQTTAAYNAMLTARKSVLASAETTLSTEFKARGGDWRDTYDDSMTRLYNYWSQDFARAGFCAAAKQALAAAPGVPDAEFASFATTQLALLDQPFTDFFRAYDAWRTQAALVPVGPRPLAAPVVAAAATVQAVPRAEPRTQMVTQAVPARATATPLVAKDLPRLNVDASALN
ncbi:hypothetical protein [Sphingomonas sp. Mn802worker]|uniref:hypothetical protein n=1 Tax=Sphingomonas sp. Mn802worker TaxID=629773 RepID=UPI0003A93B9D|nr:hypothetical protein [Sphingomonas sp. Mn802worker]